MLVFIIIHVRLFIVSVVPSSCFHCSQSPSSCVVSSSFVVPSFICFLRFVLCLFEVSSSSSRYARLFVCVPIVIFMWLRL